MGRLPHFPFTPVLISYLQFIYRILLIFILKNGIIITENEIREKTKMIHRYKIRVWHEMYGKDCYIIKAKNANEALAKCYDLIERDRAYPEEWQMETPEKLDTNKKGE